MSHSDDGVGDRGSNVGTHDHVDGSLNIEASRNKRHHDGGGGGRTLEKHSGKNSNHETGNWVRVVAEKRSSRAATENLGGSSEELKSEKEEVEEEDEEANSGKYFKPFLGLVYTASTAYFTPCGITYFILVFLVEVGVTESGGSRYALIAILHFRGFWRFDVHL
jgi:hypothetical protein